MKIRVKKTIWWEFVTDWRREHDIDIYDDLESGDTAVAFDRDAQERWGVHIKRWTRGTDTVILHFETDMQATMFLLRWS